jgi:hypothetical protein
MMGDQQNNQEDAVPKQKYYFDDYLQKKYKVQNNLNEKLKKYNKIPKNTLTIVVDNHATRLNAIQIFEAMEKSLEQEEISNIFKLRQDKFTYDWLVQFKDDVIFQRIKERNLSIFLNENNPTAKLIDPSAIKMEPAKVTLTSIIRFHRHPWDLPKENLNNYLKGKNIKSLKIEEESDETYKDPRMSHILNGIYRMKINYDINDVENVKNLIGSNMIAGHKIIIQLVGHPPRCDKCKKFGHPRKECDLKETYATAAKGTNEEANELDENEENFEGTTQQENTNKNTEEDKKEENGRNLVNYGDLGNNEQTTEENNNNNVSMSSTTEENSVLTQQSQPTIGKMISEFEESNKRNLSELSISSPETSPKTQKIENGNQE